LLCWARSYRPITLVLAASASDREFALASREETPLHYAEADLRLNYEANDPGYRQWSEWHNVGWRRFSLVQWLLLAL
jgi:hypothetical protein